MKSRAAADPRLGIAAGEVTVTRIGFGLRYADSVTLKSALNGWRDTM